MDEQEAWMAYSGCAAEPDLPWILPPKDVRSTDASLMRLVCRECPVRDRCIAFVERKSITSGFWAGAFRDSDPDDWFLDGVA